MPSVDKLKVEVDFCCKISYNIFSVYTKLGGNFMKRMNGKFIAMGIAAAMTLTAVAPAGIAQAAKKPKLVTKTMSVKVKQSKTIQIQKKAGFKITFASKNKKVATVTAKGKVTGKKRGSTSIVVSYKKGKAAKKKLGTVNVKVTSSVGQDQETQAPKPSEAATQSAAPSAAATQPATQQPQETQAPVNTDGPTQLPEGPTPTPELDMNNRAVANYPTLYSDIPDLDIIRVDGAYYMVSTTMNMCPGVPIMKSTDLVHWEIVNYVYDTFEDDDITNLENGKHMYGKGSWAASLKYNEEEGKFYVAFNSNNHGFFVYTTTDIENGTWEKHFTKNSFHDPALLFDEGNMYVIYGGNLQQLELDDESHEVVKVGDQVQLISKGKHWGLWEGSHAYKIGEYYYIFIIASPSTGWMRTEVCYRSKELKSKEWEEQIVYQGGSGGGGAGLAQGGIVDTIYGDWYGFLFQDRDGVGRIPSIVAVNWDYTDDEGNNYEDWPIMGTYDEDGNFKPSYSEEEMKINLNDSGRENYFVGDDDFTYAEGDKLKLVWQWNHNPQNAFWSVTDNPGYLRLTTDRISENIFRAHNSLTQRTYGPSCASETKISVANMKVGDFAGLASVANHGAMVGILFDEDGHKYITQASQEFSASDTNKKDMVINEQIPLEGASDVYLKINYSFGNGDKATFSYSLNGTDWNEIGQQQKLAFSTDTTFMGARTWLFNYATQEAGGYVDFDYYKIYD